MMGIGFPELMVSLIIIMIIFGAGKLPEIGNAFGRSIKNFKQSMKEAEEASSEPNAEVPAAEGSTPPSEQATTEGSPPSEQATTEGSTPPSEQVKTEAAKKEEEIIDESAEEVRKNRIGTIKTPHDGLVQQGDVFTDSLRRTPGGRGSDRGVSRDVF